MLPSLTDKRLLCFVKQTKTLLGSGGCPLTFYYVCVVRAHNQTNLHLKIRLRIRNVNKTWKWCKNWRSICCRYFWGNFRIRGNVSQAEVFVCLTKRFVTFFFSATWDHLFSAARKVSFRSNFTILTRHTDRYTIEEFLKKIANLLRYL